MAVIGVKCRYFCHWNNQLTGQTGLIYCNRITANDAFMGLCHYPHKEVPAVANDSNGWPILKLPASFFILPRKQRSTEIPVNPGD